MDIIVDTSAIVAMTLYEPSRAALISATIDATLIAPPSLHWEYCNALTSLLKRKQLTYELARSGLSAYERISIHFVDVPHEKSLAFAARQNLYAYDAYFVICAQLRKAPLLTLDRGLARAARAAEVELVEVHLSEATRRQKHAKTSLPFSKWHGAMAPCAFSGATARRLC